MTFLKGFCDDLQNLNMSEVCKTPCTRLPTNYKFNKNDYAIWIIRHGYTFDVQVWLIGDSPKPVLHMVATISYNWVDNKLDFARGMKTANSFLKRVGGMLAKNHTI